MIVECSGCVTCALRVHIYTYAPCLLNVVSHKWTWVMHKPSTVLS